MKKTMRGIVKEKGEVGAVYREDLAIPEIGDTDVLVKVKASAICGTDMHIYDWTKWAQDRLKHCLNLWELVSMEYYQEK